MNRDQSLIMVYRPCFYKADILIPITGLIVLLEAINILFKNIYYDHLPCLFSEH